MSDNYLTIKENAETRYLVKGSKFIAYSFEVRDEEEIKKALLSIKSIHPKATHHCYAYRMALDKNIFRANDDGEPSYTAGKPILNELDSRKLCNTMIIVVRYFGGTQLGVPGLIEAYGRAAKDVLDISGIKEMQLSSYWRLECSYAVMNDIAAMLKKHAIEMLHVTYTDVGAMYDLRVSLQLKSTWSLVFIELESVQCEHLYDA